MQEIEVVNIGQIYDVGEMNTMPNDKVQWEYLTIIINSPLFAEEWVELSGGGEKVIGLSNILNYYGEVGWELVSLRAAWFSIFGLRAVFKREK